MKWGSIFHRSNAKWIGVGLLALCYVLSLQHVFEAGEAGRNKEIVTLRIAHFSLEVGVREALDAAGREYTRLHPNVRIEQVPVPDRVYNSWLVSQLVGGTAPDLIALNANISTDYYVRYFLPLTETVEKPNPYNAGTPLEGKRWRDTFLDGLSFSPAYNSALMEVYGAGPLIGTVRIYYNKDLYSKVMGAAPGTEVPPPANYGEFLRVCERIEAYSRETRQPLVPLSGSSYNGPLIMSLLFSSQTQKPFSPSIDEVALTSSGPESNAYETGMSYLRGEWNFRTPAIAHGISLMHDVSRHMQLGFMQVQREDSTFYFLQQRAVMIVTGSWDVKSLGTQASFPIGICAIPLPAPDDPTYGAFVRGKSAEGPSASGGTTGAVGVTRGSAHPEVAIDFLRFLTSAPGAGLFCRVSNLLPGVEGVPVPKEVRDFTPVLDGYPGGMALNQGVEIKRVFNSQFYRLAAPGDGAVADFSRGLEEAGYRDAILSDMRGGYRSRLQVARRSDVTLASFLQYRQESPAVARKFAELSRRQDEAEATNYRLAGDLQSLGLSVQP